MSFAHHPLLAGLRSLWRTPGATLLMLAILALGIAPMVVSWNHLVTEGALGVRPEDRVVLLGYQDTDGEMLLARVVESRDPLSSVPWALYQELARSQRSFELVTASPGARGDSRPLELQGERHGARVAEVDARLPALLGMQAAWGRCPGPGDLAGGVADGAALSLDFARRTLGPRPVQAVARRGLQSFRIVGALREPFPSRRLQRADVFLPFDGDPARPDAAKQVVLLARLKPGVALAAAREELRALSRQWEPRFPWLKRTPLTAARPVSGAALGVWLSATLVGLPFFVVACLSISGLMLARGLRREPELALHAALGAPRWRMLLGVLGEPLVLALASALLAWGPTQYLWGKAHPGAAALGWRPLLGMAGILGLCVLLTALLPVLRSLGRPPAPHLAHGPHAGDPRASRWHRRLCALQITVAMGLLGTSALFLHKAKLLHGVKACPTEERLLWVRAPRGMPAPRRQALQDWLAARPEVASLTAGSGSLTSDHPPLPMVDEDTGTAFPVEHSTWDARYPAVSGLPLLAGRWPERRGECALSRGLASRIAPGALPLGRRLALHFVLAPEQGIRDEVVGIVEDERVATPFGNPGERALNVFHPLERRDGSAMQGWVLALMGPAKGLAPGLEKALRAWDPETSTWRLEPVAETGNRPMLWFFAGLLGVLGLFSLLLQGLGLTALMHLIMATRLREFGIRQALGASPRGLTLYVLGEALRMVRWGLPLGALFTILGGRVCTALLIPMPWIDPASLLAASVVTLGAALLAALPAARKVALVPTAKVLREL